MAVAAIACVRNAGKAVRTAKVAARGFTSTAHAAKADFSFDPPGRHHLFVPGPTNIPESVQRAMMRQSLNHRDPFFPALTYGVLEDLKKLYKTKDGQCFVFPATGTGAWEAGLTNCLSPGDKVIMPRMGTFSHLWIDQAQRLGLDVIVQDEKWGRGADEERIRAELAKDKDHKIKAVCVVHNETTTGVTSDVAGVRKVMDDLNHPALLMVDGVSSIGSCEFEFDKWRVDVAMTGSQKALSMPTGLALTCVSPKAMEARKTATLPRVFFSFDDMDKMNKQGNFPYTPSIPLLYGLREQLDRLEAEGFDNVVARHGRLAEATRKAVKAWGLTLLCEEERWNSNSLTVVKAPEGMDTTELVQTLYCKYNLSLGLGLMKVQGKVFRIGHLGDMNEVSLLGALAGTEMGLLDMGYDLTPGSGVGAATDYLQRTSFVIPTREIIEDPALKNPRK